MLHGVEDDHFPRQHEERFRPVFLFLAQRDLLEFAHYFVVEAADGAPEKGRKAGISQGLRFLHKGAQREEAFALFTERFFRFAGRGKISLSVFHREDAVGVDAYDGVASEALAAFHRFQKEDVLFLREAPEDRDRRLEVGQELPADRDELGARAHTCEFIKTWFHIFYLGLIVKRKKEEGPAFSSGALLLQLLLGLLSAARKRPGLKKPGESIPPPEV